MSRYLLGISIATLGALTACAKTSVFGGGGGGEIVASSASIGPKPVFGTTHTLTTPPPAITGGTLLVTKDGRAVASDPERDQVYVVDLGTSVVTTVPLQVGDEPGRLAEDDAGHVHVALRRGGAVVTLALGASPTLIARRRVCPAPRGITYDVATGNLVIACMGGELVTMPSALGAGAATTVRLEQDLRDVFVVAGTTFVTRMRSAELLAVGPDRTIVERQSPPTSPLMMAADTAWRTVLSGSDLVMIHQRAFTGTVSTEPGGYSQSGSGCEGSSIVESTVTTFGATLGTGMAPSGLSAPVIPNAVLPVDIAVAPDGSNYALVAAGNGKTPELPSVIILSAGTLANEGQSQQPCDEQNNTVSLPGNGAGGAAQAIAVAYAADGRIIAQTREPASLFIIAPTNDGTSPSAVVGTITLATDSHEDTGHSIFHSNAGGFVACGSCHAEGGEDGRVWTFDDTGPRRTQSVRGTIEGTAPYHWDGTLADLPALSAEVFVKRMSGDALNADQITALQSWLFSIPRPSLSPPPDASAAARGQALFNDASVGCTACHNGPRLTNNATVDVGTGGAFQVPALVGVAWRAPYLHDGRASLLQNRFDPTLGGGDTHGHTSQLSPSQIDDLVSYLGTL